MKSKVNYVFLIIYDKKLVLMKMKCSVKLLYMFNFVIFLTQINLIKTDLPVHCLANSIEGKINTYFKEKTLGKTIVLGLNTFKSIGEKPLPDRKHIILNNDSNYKIPENLFFCQFIRFIEDFSIMYSACFYFISLIFEKHIFF